MENIFQLSDSDRMLIANLTRELRRFNDNSEENRSDMLFSVKMAAEYLGKTRQTIRNMCKDKRLTTVMRGGQSGILKSELDRINRKRG